MPVCLKIRVASAFALAALFLSPAAGAQALDPLELLPGYWGWVGESPDGEGTHGTCADHPMQIWFSEAGARYNSRWAGEDEVSTSSILGHLPATSTSAGFLIRYDGEERLDDAGQPVEWILIMVSQDEFFWVRRDWELGYRTRSMLRCDEGLIG